MQLTREWLAKLENVHIDIAELEDDIYVDFLDTNRCSFSLKASKLQDGKIYGTVCEWQFDPYPYEDEDADEDGTVSVELSKVTIDGLATLIDMLTDITGK